MNPKKRITNTWMKLLGSALLLLGISAGFPAPAAEANYFSDLYNGLQNFSELPGEVNQLQENYQKTVEELQQTKDQLGQTVDALGETQDQLGQTLEQMETYRTQNEALQEQNRQLSLVVDELKNDRTARENYYNRIKVTVITGLALILGYFLIIRLLRFTMRHRSRKGDRLRDRLR
jgi:septal ring factor EnvC (AmiA/AmiB activator)